jgi:hypothetical protein
MMLQEICRVHLSGNQRTARGPRPETANMRDASWTLVPEGLPFRAAICDPSIDKVLK